jgi:prepilin-type N-terminal cleavage/methylation domain-containing protein/prepilin-type processing-associated H-X9-DG protein
MTLVEVLVVVAIIGILFAIAIPVISEMKTTASRAASASNLRQIGVAILLYTGENDGRLPGPTKGGQYPIYGVSKATRENLASYLSPYLNLPALTSGSAPAEIFAFPAYQALHKGFDSAPSYFAKQRVSEGTTNYNPWGYAQAEPAASGSPVKVLIVGNAGLSNTWALTEMDQQLSVLDPGSGWFARLPAKPFHGATRNTLFFDGSVRNFPNED